MAGHRLGLFTPVLLIVAALAGIGAGLYLWQSSARAATPVDIAIDMDITGNTPRLSGGTNVQACAAVTGIGTTHVIDVLIPTPGVANADGIRGFQFDLNYDPGIVSVTAETQAVLLVQAAPSSLVNLSNSVPDTDGVYTGAAVDFGSAGIEPAGSSEKGPGVISRITLTTVGSGTSNLTLTNVGLLSDASEEIPVNATINAQIVVDGFCPTYLTVTKVVNNTGGGTALPGDFTLRINGNVVPQGVPQNVGPGTHVVTEDSPGPAYATTYGGNCAANGSITLVSGDSKTCIVTNTFVPPTITVNKVVVNTGGGTAVPGDFTVRIDGNAVARGVPITVTPGPHIVSEDGNSAYAATFSVDCSVSGLITVSGGENKVCTITNTFIPPTITINKLVNNTDGGTAIPADFILRIDGNAVPRSTPIQVTPGSHTVSEDQLPGYVGSFSGDCGPTGQVTVLGGEAKTCTLTNTFSPATIIAIGSGTAAQGGNVTVPLTATNIPSIGAAAIQIDVLFDAAALTPTGCVPDPGAVFSTEQCNINYATGRLRVALINQTGVSGNQTLANITFIGLGDSALTFDTVPPDEITITDQTGAPLPFSVQGGFIAIGPPNGDVDCDGDIDAVDGLFVLQFVVALRADNNNCPPLAGELYGGAADVDLSSTVNAVDSLFILQCSIGMTNILCP